MNQIPFIQIALIILFLPLAGFFFTLLFGKKIKQMYLFETAIITIALGLSIYMAWMKLAYFAAERVVSEFTWIDMGNTPGFGKLTVELGMMIDNVTVLLLFVVCLISALVHYFSIEYMKGDKRYNRFFAYLGIFTFSMLGIVFTHNMLMMYIFWELVGLSSYLLIGFWYEKKSASDAAKKAFIVNRVGDVGMLAGILIMFITYKTFTFDKIFLAISQGHLPFNSEFWLTALGILLFCGAIGKSAQFPLHVWLPDAMEGPTPVSALIHAATMVAAGVYLTVRIFPLLTGDALLFIATVGALSAFIPATIALTQNDIKKVLAYSTISQLGYMVMALGVGAYAYGFFHLVTHAFFKAGLFLGSGSVIHAMHHEQDIQKMGGLKKKLPKTYYTFLIFSLAISGIPLTSGFLSKDGILASAYAFGSLTGYKIFAITGFLVALLTAFYMFRLLILTFHGEPKNKEKYDHAHESPALMTYPLILLAILSIFAFYTANPTSAEKGWVMQTWLKTPETVVPQSSRYSFMAKHEEATVENKEAQPQHETTVVHSEEYMEAMHHAHYPAMFLSLGVAVLGILTAFFFYFWKKVDTDKLVNSIKPLYNFSLNKWYFDELYDMTIVNGTMVLSRFLAWFDNTIVDGIVNGSATVTRFISRVSGLFDTYVVDGIVNLTATLSGLLGIFVRKIQTGKVQTYLILVIFSLVMLTFIYLYKILPFGLEFKM
ncbi:MAG: NADH-quinone oxidoreductase subunit L [Ignavibacteriales bacterium]|nr:NADH-quinone oxidoreductase subunit L [Ignavibacteriales bacterium]